MYLQQREATEETEEQVWLPVYLDYKCNFAKLCHSWLLPSSVRSRDVQDLLRRIDQLEEALAKAQTAPILQNLANSDDQPIPTPPEVICPQIPTGESSRKWAERSSSLSTPAQAPTHSSGNHTKGYPRDVTIPANQLGPNWFFNGIPISSEAGYQWISTRTGQTTTSVDFSIPIKQSSPFSLSGLPPPFFQEACELPRKDTAREILSAFFRSSTRLMFLVLDEFLFAMTLETAYESLDEMPLSAQLPARACVLSALSIAPRSKASTQLPLFIDADMCAAKAHALLMHIAGDNSLATLQTALILVGSIRTLSFTSEN
ncbi:hypothetical protein PHISCL_02945 [Aspergillus sclerotialis]|uniref:Uncharacterized protein n=1 Tax=Aspergillus sclerotialis TaxID=2070753 RepID=A0A3A2ZP67_9EURO|nr:hypothetical protein PHISCL_02945 [Aspergillus sclerotialis]